MPETNSCCKYVDAFLDVVMKTLLTCVLATDVLLATPLSNEPLHSHHQTTSYFLEL